MAEAGGKLIVPWRRVRMGVACAAALSASVFAQAALPAVPESPLGRWLTHNRDGVFQIDRCGDVLCGRLVGMRYSGSMPLDVNHRPQCGLQLLNGFKPAEAEGRWSGSITDPDNGHAYRATIWSPEPDVLKLRGYLLLPILGETQSWTRYRGAIGMACKLPD